MSRARVQGWIDPALGERCPEAADPARLFACIGGLVPSDWLRRAPGRETFAWPGRPDLVVKRLAGRGALRDRWLERWRGSVRSPARREAQSLAGLAAAGVTVPRPLAWVEAREPASGSLAALRPARLSGALVMQRVVAGADLASALACADGARRAELGAALLALVTRLHGAGWYHRDLYLHHLRLTADGLCLFDAGRVRRAERPRERWLVKDLAALLSTLPAGISRAAQLRFLHGWCEALGRGAPTRALACRIARKGARLAAHRPRFVEPGGRLDAARDPARAAEPGASWDPRSATS